MKRIFYLIFFICLFFGVAPVKAMVQDTTLMPTNQLADTLIDKVANFKQDSLLITIPLKSIWGEDCEELLCEGMSENDYQQSMNISWIPLINDGSSYKSELVDLMKYTKYSDFEAILSNLTKSSICKVFYSTLSSADGRKMFTVEIGSGEEFIILTAGTHAREISNPQFLLKFASSLVNAYENGDTNTKFLLSQRKIIILPCINPDGYSAVLEGKNAIQNKGLYVAGISNQEVINLKSNANGVDLNRSFPNYSAAACWKGVEKTKMLSTKPSCYYYPGKQLGVENETKVTINFLEKYIPLACVFVDLHSAGRIIYAGKPHLSDMNNQMAQSFGEFIAKKTHYSLYGLKEEVTGLGADGTLTDYAAEIAAGFIYCPQTGRLMPPNWEIGKLVKTYNQTKHNIGILTIETTLNQRGKTTTKPTTNAQYDEWTKFNLLNMFTSIASFTNNELTMEQKNIKVKPLIY